MERPAASRRSNKGLALDVAVLGAVTAEDRPLRLRRERARARLSRRGFTLGTRSPGHDGLHHFSSTETSLRARTAWHSHALGQTLYVTEGAGLVQSRGGEIVHIRSGDIVHAPPDEWHWHGATADDFMTHLSLTEGVGESQKPESEWGALVPDSEYHGKNQQAT